MKKRLEITIQEKREYKLLAYLFDVQQQYKISNRKLYLGNSIDAKTLKKLQEDLVAYNQLYVNTSNAVDKKGASSQYLVMSGP